MKTLFLALLSVLIVAGSTSSAPAQPPPGGPRAMIDQLGLTPDQKGTLRDLLRANRMGGHKTQRMMMQERQRLMGFYDDYSLNEKGARDSIGKINHFQLDLANNSLERQKALRTVLTPDQLVRFNKITGPEHGGPGRGEEGPRLGGSFRSKVMPQLKLSADQQARIEKSWQVRRSQSEGLYRSMSRDSQAISRLYDNSKLDERAARRLILSINASQLQLAQLRLRSQLNMRKTLTEDQFRVLAEHVRKMAPPPGGPDRMGRPDRPDRHRD